MKTFIINDFYFQCLLFSFLLISIILPSTRGFAIMTYYLIAVDHLISANWKMFSATYRKSTLFKMYYSLSMLFIIILFSGVLTSEIRIVDLFWNAYGTYVISFGVCGTPVLAVAYYLICLNDYRKQLKK